MSFRLGSPLVLASGIIGASATLMARAARAGAGMVTAKSCGPAPRPGHPNPVALDWGGGLINAIGLSNPGAEREAAVLAEAKRLLQPLGAPLIASIFAGAAAEFGQVAAVVAQARPDLIEVNISCPNVGDEFGTPFAGAAESAAAVTESVRRALDALAQGPSAAGERIPISVKLAPNAPDIARIAASVAEAGADAITAVNTMPGMVVDAASALPVLSNRVGGVSGPALKPIALRAVYEISQAVRLPIIGTGGVLTGQDAAEMLMAGAAVVGVGSAVWRRGVEVFGQINAELAEILARQGLTSVVELRRKAHLTGAPAKARAAAAPPPPASGPTYEAATPPHGAGLPQAMRIVAIAEENTKTKTFTLDGRLEAAPGQFVMAWLPGVDEKPFSLARADPVTLTVAAVGPFSRALHGLAVGDRIWVRGPLGRGYTLPPARGSSSDSVARPHALLIGGGYGVAPLRFLAERLLAAGCAVSMIIGARTAADLLLVDAFRSLGVALWLTSEDGSAGLRGLATDALEPALAAAPAKTAMVYACGPSGMLKAIAAICQSKGLPAQLSWEAHVRCAIGLCGSCEIGQGWLVCLDGPVLPFDPWHPTSLAPFAIQPVLR